MAKQKSLVTQLLDAPIAQRTGEWLTTEIVEAIDAWHESADLKARYPRKADLARALISKCGLKVRTDAVVARITERTPNGR